MQELYIDQIYKIDLKFFEEIKKLRTNLLFSTSDAKIINVTSSVGKEGKSTVAFWLSLTLAEMGKKVVLIDANLRKNEKSNIFKIFSDKNNTILSTDNTLKNYLMDKVNNKDIIFKSNIENLHLILSGYETEKPSELLSNQAFGNLITYLRENYSYVIIDTPAVGEVTDAVIIAKHCDGSLLVLEPGVVPYPIAQNVKKEIENNGTKLLGVVLNKI